MHAAMICIRMYLPADTVIVELQFCSAVSENALLDYVKSLLQAFIRCFLRLAWLVRGSGKGLARGFMFNSVLVALVPAKLDCVRLIVIHWCRQWHDVPYIKTVSIVVRKKDRNGTYLAWIRWRAPLLGPVDTSEPHSRPDW